MNWLDIDKTLHNLYTAWDGNDREDYYKLVMRQFKWTHKQAVVATDLIFKQRQNYDYAPGSRNELKQHNKKKSKQK